MRTHTGFVMLATLMAVVPPVAAGPTLGGPMSHLLVTVFDQRVFLSFESQDLAIVTMQRGEGFSGPASVLNDTGYNAQFGWLANGFVSLPTGAGVFIRTLSASPWLSVYAESGFAPILGTDGSDPLWRWSGAMTHNWYATRVQGPHHAAYEVFVGDSAGRPLDGWTPGAIGLRFEHGSWPEPLALDPAWNRPSWPGSASITPVPAPGGVVVAMTGLLFARRRR